MIAIHFGNLMSCGGTVPQSLEYRISGIKLSMYQQGAARFIAKPWDTIKYRK
jgi:hypothetical protein